MILALFLGFSRVGLLTFGGGPAMIPLMQAECVSAGWVTDAQFLEGLAAGNALPGPIATKMAVWVGWHAAGVPGAVSAFLGISAPSAILMGVLGSLIVKHRSDPWVAAALSGVKPAIVGMLAYTVWELAPEGVPSRTAGVIAVVAFLALLAKVHPGVVVLGAMAAGVALYRG